MREHWIKIHLEQRISVPRLSELSGIHEDTLYLWKTKYLREGREGLADKSRAPLSSPNQYPEYVQGRIRFLRAEGLQKEKRYIGPKVISWRLKNRFGVIASPSGIGKFLHNKGLVPEKKSRRRPKKERIKRCKIHEPGELAQMDVKYAIKSYAGWWYYEFDAIDYVSGVVTGEIYEIQSNLEAILFLKTLKRKLPFLKGVQTDNGSIFTNYYTGYTKSADPIRPRLHPFDIQCLELGINHYLIDPGKPAQNGKIERFHRTVEEEFYQHQTFKDLNSLRKKFRDYLYYFNNEREHQGLGGLTPIEKLRSFPQYEKVGPII